MQSEKSISDSFPSDYEPNRISFASQLKGFLIPLRKICFLFLLNLKEYDCNDSFPFDYKSNEILFGPQIIRKTLYGHNPFNLFECERFVEEINFPDCGCHSLSNRPRTEKTNFPFPFTLNGIWSRWQFSFRF